jgi:hypothetical protein
VTLPPDEDRPAEEADTPRAHLREQMRAEARARAQGRPARPRAPLALAAGLFAAAVSVLVAIVLVLGSSDGALDAPDVLRRLPGWFGRTPATTPAPPAVEPVVLMDVAPETARQLNAAVPFAPGPLPAARPFTYPGSAENRAAARLCLAAAVLYEAGNSPVDQLAVAQVVVNRVRHPAFARTICGVVFQGAERRTGCQFTFACDGALARHPSPAAWNGALASADAALSGLVFSPVGTATHYHTDAVFPYWQSSLTKLVAIGPHIFYRWRGWWGTTPAFAAPVSGKEQVDPRLLATVAGLQPTLPTSVTTPEEIPAAPLAPDATVAAPASADPPVRIPDFPAGLLKDNIVRLVDADATTIVLRLNPSAFSGSLAILANAICDGKPRCLVAGFLNEATVPKSLATLEAQLGRADFLFRRRPGVDLPEMQWNCAAFPRSAPGQCRGS